MWPISLTTPTKRRSHGTYTLNGWMAQYLMLELCAVFEVFDLSNPGDISEDILRELVEISHWHDDGQAINTRRVAEVVA